ncbi:MAG: AAA family ATPase [Acidobacteriia bacterium]|nr:AAA family ATPase [Terriglobia bacterium]
MYCQFFGLDKEPFGLTPDPAFLYLTPQHREALAGFTYGILAQKGFVVLTGSAGTGKTTLLTRVMQHLPVARVRSSVIVNPTLTAAEFLEAVLLDFEFTDIPASKPQRIAALQRFLWDGQRAGKISALIVDEAHKLSLEVLEEIRLLGNFEAADQKLLQIGLVGQSELDELLDRDQLRQFKQRIALRTAIGPLALNEVPHYVRHRWLKAGGAEPPFSPEAMAGIGQASEGVPRVVNVICDNALILAFGEGSGSVEARHVLGACRDLRLAAEVPQTKTNAPAPRLADPAPPPAYPVPAVDGYQMKTLERYCSAGGNPSLWSRLAGKLGIQQRGETA